MNRIVREMMRFVNSPHPTSWLTQPTWLGKLLKDKDKTAREAILERGGEGSQVHELTIGYADKTLDELAAKGGRSAVTALKIVKQARVGCISVASYTA